MTIVRFLLTGTAVTLVVAGGKAISVEDKYALQVPNGLAFSDFRGYESWQTVSVSHAEETIEVILGNPAMIDAYRSGIPGNGRPFPDGAKMAKIHWNTKKSEDAPTPTIVPDALHGVDFMQKDSKKFADTHGWGYAQFPHPTRSSPWAMTPSAGPPAMNWLRERTTSSRFTGKGKDGRRPTQCSASSPFVRGVEGTERASTDFFEELHR